MSHVIGIDGCRRGWVAACVGPDIVRWSVSSRIGDLFDPDADAIGVDCPIGLPETEQRACDVAARAFVGPRRSSVFPPPPRAVFDVESYAAARALLAAQGQRSMSAQAFGIVRAVRQVDAAMTPALEPRVIEVHPEASFRKLSGEPLASKRSREGVGQRMAALRGWLDVDTAVAAAPRSAALDDRLDALAVAWTADRWRRGEAQVLGDGARDARGLLMRIVV
jgi:predicted RNase H-like nuclease